MTKKVSKISAILHPKLLAANTYVGHIEFVPS